MPDPADPTARALRLLSLLQAHRHWSGRELTDALGVSARTLRRDVDRLRSLGYPIDAVPGIGGGYRLAAGTTVPPLLLDDDEVVAIAVGVRTAVTLAVAGIEDTALSALAKLEHVLPPRLRRRVDAVGTAVAPTPWAGRSDEPPVDPSDLGVLALAVRDAEQVRFRYTRHDGTTARRDVEPHAIVPRDRRWYLLAWDLRRRAWRTFRLDRLDDVQPAAVRFRPRAVPGGDPAAYVARSQAALPGPLSVTVRVAADPDRLRALVTWTDLDVEAAGEGTARVRLRDHAEDWLCLAVATLAAFADVEVEAADPPWLRDRIAALGRRLALAGDPDHAVG